MIGEVTNTVDVSFEERRSFKNGKIRPKLIAIYPPPIGRIYTLSIYGGACNANICCFDYGGKRLDLSYKHLKPQSILKFDEETILLSASNELYFYLVKNSHLQKKITIGDAFSSMYRLDTNLVILHGNNKTVFVDTERMTKIWENVDWQGGLYTKTVKSRNFFCCFYVTTYNNGYPLFFGSYKTRKTLKRIDGNRTFVYSLDLFLNQQGEEILVYGGYDGQIIFQNMGGKRDDPTKIEPKMIRKVRMVDSAREYSWPRATLILQDRYFLVGGSEGSVFVYDLWRIQNKDKKETPLPQIYHRKVGKDKIKCLDVLKFRTDSFQLLIAPEVADMVIMEVKGVRLKSLGDEALSLSDLKERVDFLMDLENIFFHEEKTKEFRVVVKTKTFEWEIPKFQFL